MSEHWMIIERRNRRTDVETMWINVMHQITRAKDYNCKFPHIPKNLFPFFGVRNRAGRSIRAPIFRQCHKERHAHADMRWCCIVPLGTFLVTCFNSHRTCAWHSLRSEDQSAEHPPSRITPGLSERGDSACIRRREGGFEFGPPSEETGLTHT